MYCGRKCGLAELLTSKAMMLKPTAAAKRNAGLETREVMLSDAASRATTGAGKGECPVLLPDPLEHRMLEVGE